jgi:hypothetical protein
VDPLASEIRAELSRFGPQAGMPELLDRWPDAVGATVARFAWPARIARDGTVHVNTADSIWAFELAQRSREIAGRLGVEKLRFAPGPLPSAAREPHRTAVEPTPEEEERAAALASRIGDEKLRESVQKAVRLALARERHDRSV